MQLTGGGRHHPNWIVLFKGLSFRLNFQECKIKHLSRPWRAAAGMADAVFAGIVTEREPVRIGCTGKLGFPG